MKNRLNFILDSRGAINSIKRLSSVVRRFRFNENAYLKLIEVFSKITNSNGALPSFPICANLLERYPPLAKKLQKFPIQLCSHGYHHIDFSAISIDEQLNYLLKSQTILKENNIEINGFRAPYLHWNIDTIKALKETLFQFNSSAVHFWDNLENLQGIQTQEALKKAKNFYLPYKSNYDKSFPYFHENGLLEIPVSLPDDEILIDRLEIRDPRVLKSIWMEILQRSYRNENLFTLQLHPERILFLQDILVDLLQECKKLSPQIWLTDLKSISQWWYERNNYSISFDDNSKDHTILEFHKPSRGVLYGNSAFLELGLNEIDKHNSTPKIKGNKILLPKGSTAAIGLLNNGIKNMEMIKNLGYPIITEINKVKPSLVFTEKLSRSEITNKIQSCSKPLVKLSYWPENYQSAFCISGDIDSVTLQDFFLRFIER